MPSYLDERIAEALAIPRFHANQLVCILAYVDAHEKLVLNLEEMCGGLERLIQSGRIPPGCRQGARRLAPGQAPNRVADPRP